MATVTLTPGTVTHTLPDKFYGFGFAAFFHEDAVVGQWQALVSALQMEIFRSHMWRRDANYSGWDNTRLGVLALTPRPVAQMNIDIAPAVLPSTAAPNDINNFNTGARGTVAYADLYQEWVNAGIDVRWVEIGNEPVNMFTLNGTDGAGVHAWFSAVSGYSAGKTEQPVRRDCESWYWVQMRRWADAIRARAATLGKAVKISGLSWSNSQGTFDRDSVTKFLDGVLTNGQSNPNAVDSNMAYFDSLVDHPYASVPGGVDQADLNGMFYTPFTEGKTNLFGFFEEMRSALDARSGQTRATAWNEGSRIDVPRMSAIADIATAIAGARQQSRWNLDGCIYHSCNRNSAGGSTQGNQSDGLFDVSGSAWTPTTRYYCHRDIISPYLRRYKRQIAGGSAAAPAAPGSHTTPATANANSVAAVHYAAGVNADGTAVGVLLINIDLAAAETVTVNFGATASANVTFVRLPTTAGHASQMTSGTLAGTSGTTSTAVTLQPGEGMLLEIPITGGGGTPPVLPKINTVVDEFVAATIDGGVWTTFLGKPGYTIQPTATGVVFTSSAEPNGFAELQSLAAYDATGVRCSLSLADDGDQSLASFFPYLQLHTAATGEPYIGLRVRENSLGAFTDNGVDRTFLASVAWDPVAMQFLAIREAAGTTFWEYGQDANGDGAVEWTTLHSAASPITMTEIKIRFGAAANAQQSSAKWRWLNFVPAPGAPPPGPAARVTTLTRSTAIARTVNPAGRLAGAGGGGI